MTPELETMARYFYGFGRWNAPYWFIGPEPGGDGNSNADRARVFTQIQRQGLCDCRQFHQQLADSRARRWHRDPPEKCALQPTWRRLMLPILRVLDHPTDQESRRDYQYRKWGSENGETCVIEIGALSAKSLRATSDRKSFRESRIEEIRKRLEQNRPKVVVMYGLNSTSTWELISGLPFQTYSVQKKSSTVYAFMPSPTSHGETNQRWLALGEQIAEYL